MNRQWVGLTFVFIVVLALRLYFAFQTPFYTTDQAYLHVRAAETITHGQAPWNDALGYGGRTLVRSPVFDAILAFFTLFMSSAFVFKFIPNFFASLLVIPIYLIAHRLTKDNFVSLFSALLASIIPAFFANTFNQLSPLTLALPLFFTTLYAWLRSPERKWIIIFLLLLLVFVFLHPLSIIFVLSIGVYIILISIEHVAPQQEEYELGLFAIFFTLWAQFLIYKKLILFHGTSVIWQNIPNDLLSNFYANITVLGAIAQIGVFPLADGMYALYKTAFKKPQKETLALLAITIVSALLLWFKLVDLSTGFMLLGITLTLAFAQALLLFRHFITTTKFTKYAAVFTFLTVVFAFLTTAYPAYLETTDQLSHTITQEEYSALTKLSQTTAESAVIIAPPNYGHYITGIAKRKNVIDDYFFLANRVNERYQDVTRLYKTTFETESVELFDKYHATYLIVPPGIKDIGYSDSPCFKRIQATNIRIYEKDASCTVKVVA